RESGLATVRSVFDGRVLLEVGQREPRGWHAIAVGAAGDIDGDGTADVGVLCRDEFDRKTMLIVFSGKTGEVLRRVNDVPARRFRFVPCRDLDGDGSPDCIVASIGLLEVLFDYSTRKQLLFQASGIQPAGGAALGTAIACLRDASAIGHVPMFVVSDPDTNLWG